MLTFALLGALIGVTVSLVSLSLRKGSFEKRLRALAAEGPQAARMLLDKQIPPSANLPLSKILDQKERMATLAILADIPALEREAAMHRGALAAVVQVNAMAMLGIALRAPDRRALAVGELDRLATRVETEGSGMLALVKKKTRALAVLGHGLLGEPMHVDQQLVIQGLAKEPGAPGLLVQAAWAEALRATGQPQKAEELLAGVRQKTRALG